jgi:uncharacterized protein YndB with AHSA1/START domain
MQVIKEVELDRPAEEVWRILRDPDELAGWVGEEVRGAPVTGDDGVRRLTWTWAPDGVESTVEVTLTEHDDRTRVRVIERTRGLPTASARACMAARWDDALLTLELKALTWTHRLIHA